MASMNVLLKVRSNIETLTDQIGALASYLSHAPDSDPLKADILALGEIDCDRDLRSAVRISGSEAVVEFTLSDRLQGLVDRVLASQH